MGIGFLKYCKQIFKSEDCEKMASSHGGGPEEALNGQD